MDGHEAELGGFLHLIRVRREGDAVEELRQAQAQGFRLGRRAEELLQVADAALGLQRRFVLQALEVAALLQHPLHQAREALGLPLGVGPVEQVQELAHLPLGAALQLTGPQQQGQSFQGRAALGDGALDLPQRGGPHAPGGCVHAAAEAHQVEGVRDEAQVRDEVLHFLALVELHAAHQPVGQVLGPQRLFHLPGLPVGAVEHGHLGLGLPVPQLLDALHHPLRLQAPLVRQLEGDGLPVAQVGLQRALALHALGVVGDHLRGRVEDLLRRAVVLQQLDAHGLGEVLLEVEDVADVGATPPVDGVVRHQAVGHEGVDPFNVEIVNLRPERNAFDAGDHIQAPFSVEQGHAGHQVAGREEGQAAGVAAGTRAQAGLQVDLRVQVLPDAISHAPDVPERGRAGLHAPTLGSRFRGAHRQAQALKRAPILQAAAHHGDAVHGPLATAVAAKRHRHLPPEAVTGLGPVMGHLHRHAQVRQQPLGTGLGVHGGEHAADAFDVVDQPLGGAPLAGHEGQRRELVLERPDLLLEAGLLLAGMGGHHPQLVRMLLPGPLEEAHHRFHLATGVGLAGAQAPD